MADNIMYLRCKECGETFFLGKRLGGGYYIGQNSQHKGIPLRDRLNNFYYDHEECGYLGDDGLDCFELIYETTPKERVKKPTTNADRIRAMSNEELAMLLQPTCPPIVCKDDPPQDCYNCWIEWLNQEVDT